MKAAADHPERKLKHVVFIIGVAIVLAIAATRLLRCSKEEGQRSVRGAPVVAQGQELESIDNVRQGSVAQGQRLTSDIEITVTDQEGKAVSGAVVHCRLMKGKLAQEGPSQLQRGQGVNILLLRGAVSSIGLTDARGNTTAVIDHKRLAGPGDIHLLLIGRANGYVHNAAATYAMTVPAPDTSRQVTISLQRGKQINGQLVNMEAGEEGSLLVTFSELGQPDRTWFTLCKVRDDGSFVTEALPLKPLTFEVAHIRRKYLPVKLDVDPTIQSEILVTLQADPTFRQQTKLIVEVTSRIPMKDFNHKAVIYSEDGTRVVQDLSNRTRLGRFETDIRAGIYRVVVISLDEQPFWGEATVSVPVSGTITTTIQLEEASLLTLEFRDRASGKIPLVSELDITVLRSAATGSFVEVKSAAIKDSKRFLSDGKVVLTIPPGNLKLVIADSDEAYQPQELPLSVGSGERLTRAIYLSR